jgi:hypothetical protein
VKVRLTCRGTRTLLRRKPSPLSPSSRKIPELTAIRRETNEQLRQIAMLEFQGGLYFGRQL